MANYEATEDEVRTETNAKLHLTNREGVRGGVGQITTFNQLGISGVVDKPDGWWIPTNTAEPALILECKAAKVDISTAKCVEELRKNCRILLDAGYERVFGLLTNGVKTLGFRNNQPCDVPDEIQDVHWYLDRFTAMSYDEDAVDRLTKRLNDILHFQCGIMDLVSRATFCGCALVAVRYGAKLKLSAQLGWEPFQTDIKNALNKAFYRDRNQNSKLELLLEVFASIRMNLNVNTEDAKEQTRVITILEELADIFTEVGYLLNCDDVISRDPLAQIFQEMTRFAGKADQGQVFTPEHICRFMYRLSGCNKDSYILDATCGSGTFLVCSMGEMIREAGGNGTAKAARIKSQQLYGIEIDKRVASLAMANMLVHKDGKSNIVCADSRSEWACDWIKSNLGDKHGVTALGNLPFENKYGCVQILENILDSIPSGSKAAIIMPDRKLEKSSKRLVNRILEHHHLDAIIKLPEKLFDRVSVTTSVYLFTAGQPQNDEEFYACWIEDDGFETVKNQGRHDVRGRWASIESRAVDTIRKKTVGDEFHGQWVDPSKHLSWQAPEKPFSICEENFNKTAMDYLLFKRGIDMKTLRRMLADEMLYGVSHIGMHRKDA